MQTTHLSENTTLICGDCREVLATIPDGSVHCCITSSPYWGLRDYGTATWEGGDPDCKHSVGGQVEDGKWAGAITTGRRPGVDASRCRKCGAVRVDAQLGLESTPEEFVAHLVEVFRGVKRVLRDDGVLWIVIGDSMTSGGRSGHGTRVGYKQQTNRGMCGENDPQRAPQPVGLKPKDLCMIPARVAMALQEPYYTGAVEDPADRKWLAAIIDGEGCIYVSRSKIGAITGRGRNYFRKQDAFDVGVKVTNTHRALVEEVARILGYGSVRVAKTRDQDVWEWGAYSSNARQLIREVYPYLVAKQHEARIMLGCPPSGEQALAAHGALKGLHHGIPTDLDFPPPLSMYEPGWYLRQDLIWAKPNPMPESVTDRCCKAHEYIFLLSKSARYYFDAAAIAEPATTGDPRRPNASGVVDERGNGKDRGGGKLRDSVKRGGFGGKTEALAEDGRNAFRAIQSTRNRRSVWTVATHPYPEAHFATYPPKLIEPMILAGCPERCCPVCGMGWERVVTKHGGRDWHTDRMKAKGIPGELCGDGGCKRGQSMEPLNDTIRRETVGWRPACKCGRTDYVPGTVLDPFNGAGTTGVVAHKLGRGYIGIELNLEYVELSRTRLDREMAQLSLALS